MGTPQAPVVLFVFNRYKQLPETLECLRQNNINELYVFCDGSRGPGDDEAVKKVRSLIKNINWIKPKIVAHSHNQGLSESISAGLDLVFKTHDRVIVIEDDICVKPGFYDYMNQALETYKDSKQVAGVTGLRYPFKREAFNNYQYGAFFAARFSSWGWGTWKRFWDNRETNRQALANQIRQNSLALDVGGADMIPTFEGYLNGSLSGSWDVECAANMLVKDMVFVWPTWNMVRNTGLMDGTHASSVEADWQLLWEEPLNQSGFPTKVLQDGTINSEFLSFFKEISHKGDSVISQARAIGGKIKRRLTATGTEAAKPDPSEYTTTDGPLEVPVQKEAYFIALNQYIKTGDKVLDVGSGLGYGLNLLAIKAGEVSGVDIDDKAIAYAKKLLVGRNPKLKELKLYDGYHLPYKDKSFDVITSVDVIEHVEDYDAFIDELLRVAKRAVIISTPNRREEYTNPDGTPRNHWHLREWSREELDAIVKKHPLTVKWHHVNGPWEGPFTVSTVVKPDTMTLTPALLPKQK